MFGRFSKAKLGSQAAAAPKTGVVAPKSFKEAWCSDSGAYPVMSIIVFAVAFSSSAIMWFMTRDQDCRLSKGKRKNPYRGELRNDLINA
jgi:hypothetical protein